MTQKKHNLNYEEAKQALAKGFKVKLPEWTGYWFNEDGKIKVFTRIGEILDTPDYDSFSMRNGWEVTDGELGFDFALIAAEAGKLVSRENWRSNDKFIFIRPEDYLEAETIVDKVKSIPSAVKSFIKEGIDKLTARNKRAEENKGKSSDNGAEDGPIGLEYNSDDKIRFTSYFCYHSSDGTIVNGWTPTIVDIMAKDWKVIG